LEKKGLSIFQLRDYQEKGNALLRDAILKGNSRILYWLQTGGGKGLIMANLTQSALKKGRRVLTVMRRRELIFQTRENYRKYYGINGSVIMGSEKGFDKSNPCQICSIDTVRARLDKLEFLKEYDLIIVDECHDTTSPSYQKFFDFLGNKIFIGFTATPFRVGNKSLDFWQTVVKPIEAHELRDEGHLTPARVFAPKKMDLTGIRKVSTGDYNTKQLFDMASDSKIVGDIVETWKKYGKGATVLFAVNIAHSILMAHAFNEAGIRATHIDQSHSRDERAQAIKDLKDGMISVLCNVNIFSTGIDIPQIRTLILARPTTSEILYIQQIGRGLRPYLGKEYCIVLDHAGNSIDRFGLPYDIREACIEPGKGKKETDNEPAVKSRQCKQCFAILEPGFQVCPYCNAELKTEREIKTESGELIELGETPKMLKFKKFKSKLDQLDRTQKIKGFKTNWKYFKLYESFGKAAWEFHVELGLPVWIPKFADRNKKENGKISSTSKPINGN
jgi:superfamily II DNA or RNA helicase